MKNQNVDIPKKVRSLFFAFFVSVAFNIYTLQKHSEEKRELRINIEYITSENNLLREEISSCLR